MDEYIAQDMHTVGCERKSGFVYGYLQDKNRLELKNEAIVIRLLLID